MSIVDPACPALVAAFMKRSPRRPPPGSRSSRDPMFRRSGSSFDLKNIREYDASDDPRRIDWRLEGRTGRLYIKEFHEEERDGIVVLADVSRSLEILDREITTGIDRVTESISASIAWMLGMLGIPVLLLVFARRAMGRLDRSRGAIAASELESFFGKLRDEGREAIKENLGATDIVGAVASARRLSKYRRIAIVSDFLDPRFSPKRIPFSRAFLVRVDRPFTEIVAGRDEVDVEDPESGRMLRLPWDSLAARRYATREGLLESSLAEAARRGAWYAKLGRDEDRSRLYWAFLGELYA